MLPNHSSVNINGDDDDDYSLGSCSVPGPAPGNPTPYCLTGEKTEAWAVKQHA